MTIFDEIRALSDDAFRSLSRELNSLDFFLSDLMLTPETVSEEQKMVVKAILLKHGISKECIISMDAIEDCPWIIMADKIDRIKRMEKHIE